MKRIKDRVKRARSICNFWVAGKSLSHLEGIRLHELESALGWFPPAGRVLEIGAGAGWQAKALSEKGFEVFAVELPSAALSRNKVFPVAEYDGKKLPFPDESFDVVFSSNVLEHIPHLIEFQDEIRRVLKGDGRAVHLVPSGTWRFWSNLTGFIRTWTPPPVHGEHAAGAWSEIRRFSRKWWASVFTATGWVIVHSGGNGLFYTGDSIMDSRISLELRRLLAAVLGSACHLFVLKKRVPAESKRKDVNEKN